jgi:transcriptional regulator with XRE-family HTH domain
MEAERRTFGEILRHYRRKKYSNLQALAEKLGTSKDVLGNYENDAVLPAHDILLRLITELEIPALPLLRAVGYPLTDGPDDWVGFAVADKDLTDEQLKALETIVAAFKRRTSR